MTYDVIVGGKTYKFNTQKEQEDFINQGYGNHTRMNLGNSVTLISKQDNKQSLNPNKTYNVQLPEVEVTNGQTKIQNTGHNDPIISQIFQGNYFGKKFVPTEQNINHYLNLYKGDKQNNEKFAPKEWMKVGGVHLLAGAAIPTIATAPIATAIGAAGGYASDWLWRNYTGKSFGNNVLDWAGLQNYSNPYIDSDMIRDAADALEPLAFFTGGLGVDDITGKYITNKLIPRTKNNLAGAAMRFNTTDNVMAPSEDLMFRPAHNIWQEDVYYDGELQKLYGNYRTSPQMSLVGYEQGIPQYNMRDQVPYIHRQYITREQASPIEVPNDYKYTVFKPNDYYDGEYDAFNISFDENAPYQWYFDDKRPYSIFENSMDTDESQSFIFSLNGLPRTKKKYNKKNYFEDSFGVFTPEYGLPKDAEFLFHSPGRYGGGSTYWASKDGKTLYRDSDHWGSGIKNSDWYLKGDECPGGHCGNTKNDFYLGSIKFSDLRESMYYGDPNIDFSGRPLQDADVRNPGPEKYARTQSMISKFQFKRSGQSQKLQKKLEDIYLKMSETKDPNLIQEQINLLKNEMDTYTYTNSRMPADDYEESIKDIYQDYIDKLIELQNDIFTTPERIIHQEAEELEDGLFLAPPKRRRIRRNQEAKEIEEIGE